ncbi:hypothetical protein HDV00_006779 [Rhizophlyctis rosea]|nr:hypothetical protein HDV00_006779 [Rhizophlyctis rosea]
MVGKVVPMSNGERISFWVKSIPPDFERPDTNISRLRDIPDALNPHAETDQAYPSEDDQFSDLTGTPTRQSSTDEFSHHPPSRLSRTTPTRSDTSLRASTTSAYGTQGGASASPPDAMSGLASSSGGTQSRRQLHSSHPRLHPGSLSQIGGSNPNLASQGSSNGRSLPVLSRSHPNLAGTAAVQQQASRGDGLAGGGSQGALAGSNTQIPLGAPPLAPPATAPAERDRGKLICCLKVEIRVGVYKMLPVHAVSRERLREERYQKIHQKFIPRMMILNDWLENSVACTTCRHLLTP